MKVEVDFRFSPEEEQAYEFIEQEIGALEDEIRKLVENKLTEYKVTSLPIEIDVYTDTMQ